MKKVIILLLLSQLSYSQIAEDKKKHFIAGSLIAIPTNFFTWQMSEKPKRAFWTGLSTSIIAGVWKEYQDEQNYNGWDNEDLLATTLGGLSTSIPLYYWQKSIVKKRKRKSELRKKSFNIN